MATGLHKYDVKNLLVATLAWELIFWLVYLSLFYYMYDKVDAFQFENPKYLYLLLGIPALIAGYFTILRWKNRMFTNFAESRLLPYITLPVSSIKSFSKFFLFRNGIAFLILALANPQYGRGQSKAVSEGIEMMIALDISNSMRALDLDRKKDRLQIAKLATEQLMNSLHGDKIGIVAFAGEAFIQVPLTTDYQAAKMFLAGIRPEMMTHQGTDIALAIDKSLNTFDMTNGVNKAIIVMSDGEDHEGGAVEAATLARENGVIVATVGMGTTNETPIPEYENGILTGLKKDESGNTVYTRLNSDMLREIAMAGGGPYTQAEGSFVNFDGLLDEIKKIEKSEIDSMIYADYEDQYQWFLFLGLLMLAFEFFLSENRSGIIHKLSEYNG